MKGFAVFLVFALFAFVVPASAQEAQNSDSTRLKGPVSKETRWIRDYLRDHDKPGRDIQRVLFWEGNSSKPPQIQIFVRNKNFIQVHRNFVCDIPPAYGKPSNQAVTIVYIEDLTKKNLLFFDCPTSPLSEVEKIENDEIKIEDEKIKNNKGPVPYETKWVTNFVGTLADEHDEFNHYKKAEWRAGDKNTRPHLIVHRVEGKSVEVTRLIEGDTAANKEMRQQMKYKCNEPLDYGAPPSLEFMLSFYHYETNNHIATFMCHNGQAHTKW